MALGDLSHVDLTVRDVERAYQFYDPILRFLGMRGGPLAPDGKSAGWMNPKSGFNIAIHVAKPGSAEKAHDRYAPGLHHLAFRADSREQVDGLHRLLLERGVQVLDPPGEYYEDGYYAVFFCDPDGMKWELVHLPGE